MTAVFRDRNEGTAAKRADLLQRRRAEWATMPHAIRRVVVARHARTAAALGALVGTLGLLAAVAWPRLAHALWTALPGPNPAPLTTLLACTWVLALLAYLVSRARAEHRFVVELSRAVLPTDNVDDDIERLAHEKPDELARAMAHRLEVGSAAWPVIAMVAAMPASALYAARAIATHGWPESSSLEQSLADHGLALAACLALALVAGLVVARRGVREVSALPLLLGIALAGGLAGVLWLHASVAVWPVAAVVTASLTAAVISIVLKRERAAIVVADPAAGSEMLTLAGMVRASRAAWSRIAARIHRVPNRALFIGVPVFAIACAALGLSHRAKVAGAASTSPVALPKSVRARPIPLAKPLNEAPQPLVTTDGRLILIRTELRPGQPQVLTGLGGMDELPAGWQLKLDIHVRGATYNAPMITTLVSKDPAIIDAPGHVELSETACDASHQLGLIISPASTMGSAQQVEIEVTPTLTLGSCAPNLR